MAMNGAASYRLGRSINVVATGDLTNVWGSSGFVPIGNATTPFTGSFDGRGRTISNLTINLPTQDDVGLFGSIGPAAVVRNIGLLGGSVTGANNVGALAGVNYGGFDGALRSTVSNSYAAGSVSGANEVGGLVGFNQGTIAGSHAAGSVKGGNDVGGLVGFIYGSYQEVGDVSNSYATGHVSGSSNVGGLVGSNGGTYGGAVSNSYATGHVSGADNVGGLLGYNGVQITTFGGNTPGTVTNSHANGDVIGTGANVGGLVGLNAGTISGSFATGNVVGTAYTGGLVGYNGGLDGDFRTAGTIGTIVDSYASGSVHGTANVGGLVGFSGGGSGSYGPVGTVTRSYATGSVSGTTNVGGLVGQNGSYGTFITNSYATGKVTGTGNVGGLVGLNSEFPGVAPESNYGSVTNSYATGAVIGSSNVGGLIGFNAAGTIGNSFWDITTSGLTTSAGGIGMTTAQMQTQANFTSATAANGHVNPGWDFSNTWVMHDGHTYPLLRVFMTPPTVTTKSGTVTPPAVLKVHRADTHSHHSHVTVNHVVGALIE
jgi:hypothetical protein